MVTIYEYAKVCISMGSPCPLSCVRRWTYVRRDRQAWITLCHWVHEQLLLAYTWLRELCLPFIWCPTFYCSP